MAGAQPDGFGLGIIPRCLQTTFTPLTAQPVAPKGRNRADRALGVDPDNARLNAPDHAVRTGEVFGKAPRRRSEFRIISQCLCSQCLCFGIKPKDRQNRPEERMRQAGCVRCMGTVDSGRREIGARAVDCLPAL